jgi:cytosine/adenosine deaminase-related metal-dependent hydrolase
VSGSGNARAQEQGLVPAPDRAPGEGLGPFRKLVIRGGTLIDGTGAKPRGPVDIVITDRRITKIRDVDEADLAEDRPPFDADHEVDATGMHVLPGFIDLHTTPADRRRTRGGVSVQAVARARRHHRSRRTAGRLRVHREREAAQRAQ